MSTITTLVVCVLLLACMLSGASASHFRGGIIMIRPAANASSKEVNLNEYNVILMIKSVWLVDFIVLRCYTS